MEKPAPRDYQWAEDTIVSRGGTLVCPVCSKEDWVSQGELGNILASLLHVTPDDEHLLVKAVDGVQMGTICYAFVCANCGFVRLHAQKVLRNPPGDLGA